MSGFHIPLFPTDSVAVTVTTTVWIGVWVVVFFNLRFGWTLSGLVVPGYLVPLLFTNPTSAFVILLEAVATYWVVHTMSERPRMLPGWCGFFGRDRFLALVIVSVLVRAVGDGWLLPIVGQTLNEQFGFHLDYRNDLHSYGLIIVSLIANYFWKPGLLRGLLPIATTVGVTYLIVRYVLVELTNFNVGNLHFMYEDMSTSLMASPKAYIIVITTAFVASWMNLRYSWEFNGILIPSLLALLWHEPWKIGTSFVECLLIFAASSALLKLPVFQRTTMEGGRKLFFFFTVCFLYRLALSHGIPQFWPDLRVTDMYGFGYLLATLLAVKAHDKKFTIRVVRATVQVSLMGAAAGSFIGFLLTCAPNNLGDSPGEEDIGSNHSIVIRTDRSLVELLHTDKLLLYQMRVPESYQSPLRWEVDRFQGALSAIRRFIRNHENATLLDAQSLLSTVNYDLIVVQDRYLYLREQTPVRGWGFYVFDMERPDGLCIEVPAPLDEWATIEAGVCFFRHQASATLAIAGADRQTNQDGSADVLMNNGSIFAAFHRTMSRDNVLQIRGHTRHGLRAISDVSRQVIDSQLASVPSQLWIRKSLPRSLRLPVVKDLVENFSIRWQSTPLTNVLRDNNRHGFAELMLSRQDRRALMSRLIMDDLASEASPELQMLDDTFQHWMLGVKETIAKRGTNRYKPATVEEMLFMDEEVLQPLIHLTGGSKPSLTDDVQRQLRAINAAASVLNYHLVLLHDTSDGHDYFVLKELAEPRRHWGTYVFRAGLAEPFIVEVPRPLFEAHVFEFGLSLFGRPAASALLIAGAHPQTNVDGRADVSKLSNKVNLFNLVRQVLLREMGQRPMLVMQTRAIQSVTDADVVVATDDGTSLPAHLSPLKSRLLRQFETDSLRVRFVDGKPDTAGYELGLLLQGSALRHAENKEIVSLWLSPSLRSKFRQQVDDRAMAAQFDACGISTLEGDLVELLASAAPHAKVHTLPRSFKDSIAKYIQQRDIVQLYRVKVEWPDWQMNRLIDSRTGQLFLLVAPTHEHLPAVANLAPATEESSSTLCNRFDREHVESYIDSRATWMEFRKP